MELNKSSLETTTGGATNTVRRGSVQWMASLVNHRVGIAPATPSTPWIVSASESGTGITIANRDELLKTIESKDFVEVIQHEVNYFYEFIDTRLQKEFKEFANRHGKGRSNDFLLLTLLIVTLLLLPQASLQLYYLQSTTNHIPRTFAIVVSILAIIVISFAFISGWILLFQGSLLFQILPLKDLSSDSDKLNPDGELSMMESRGSKHSSNTSPNQPVSISTHGSDGLKPSEQYKHTFNISSDTAGLSCSRSLSVNTSSTHRVLRVVPSFDSTTSLNESTLDIPSFYSRITSIFVRFFQFVKAFVIRFVFGTTMSSSVSQTLTKQRVLMLINVSFMLSLQLYFILQFIRNIFHLNCCNSNFQEKMKHQLYGLNYLVVNVMGNNTCYDSSSEHELLSGFMNSQSLQLYILPFIFFKGLPQTPIKVIWFNYCCAVVTFFVAICVHGLYDTFPSGIVWMILTFFAIRDFQVRSMIIFLSTRNVKETMMSHGREMEANHANEMRSLIANVAHDLKTVSAVDIPFPLTDVYCRLCSH